MNIFRRTASQQHLPVGCKSVTQAATPALLWESSLYTEKSNVPRWGTHTAVIRDVRPMNGMVTQPTISNISTFIICPDATLNVVRLYHPAIKMRRDLNRPLVGIGRIRI